MKCLSEPAGGPVQSGSRRGGSVGSWASEKKFDEHSRQQTFANKRFQQMAAERLCESVSRAAGHVILWILLTETSFFRYSAGWALELGPDGKCLAALLASGAAEVKGTENQY